MTRNILVVTACLLMATAEGAFDGEFKQMGYSASHFHHVDYGAPADDGDNTKQEFLSSGDVVISTSNTFSETFLDRGLYRTIMNQPSGDWNNPSVVNGYQAGSYVDSEPSSINGTAIPAPNLILNVSLAGEDSVNPLYFSADTNIAIAIKGEAEAVESGFGFDLFIRKGSGMDESSLSGTYVRYSMGNAVYGATSNGWGNVDRLISGRSIVDFDGSGNYTRDAVYWMADRTTSEETVSVGGDNVVDSVCTLSIMEFPSSTNGTYSVEPDGTMLIPSLFGTVTNQISPDGNVLASILDASQPGYAQFSYNVVVKRPENMPTNAVDAVYFVTALSEKYSGEEADKIFSNHVEAYRAWFYLESDGTFSARGDFWTLENRLENVWGIYPPGSGNLVSGNVFSTEPDGQTIQFGDGTYTIETNGVLTLFFDGDDGEGDQMQLSADGEFLVFGSAEGWMFDAEREMGIGIRRDPPPPASVPVVFNNDMAMTPTGLVMTASMPTNHSVEIIATGDLAEGEWRSVGVFSNGTGTVEIYDPSATNGTARFYSSTFMPW